MKKFLSVFMIITSILLSMQCKVYGSDTTRPVVQTYQDWKNKLDSYSDPTNWIEELVNTTGVIVDTSAFLRDVPISIIKQYFGLDENASTDDVKDYIDQNISEGEDGYLKVTDSFKNNVINIANYYTDENISYLYSFTIDEYASARNISTSLYLKLKERISEASDLFSTVYFLKNTGNNVQIFSIDLSSYPYVYVRYDSSNVSGVYADLNLINGYDNTNVTLSGNGWNSTDQSFTTEVTSTGKVQGLLENSRLSVSPSGLWGNGSTCFVSNHTRKAIRLFNGTASATDLIYQPYYYNNDVWQDFSTSSGDYTFSPSNVNTVTYGDVTSYIDSFNTENGYPPSVQDIEVNIKNEDTNNKDDSDGGGSGDDDSGGSGIGDIGDIFGWLKALGSVIASLIKGVGEFVTEIMGGIVEAINTLLDGLSNIITTVTEAIPSVFMQFIQACFDWMPDEWIALLTASLLLMILWGIIKLIRGS